MQAPQGPRQPHPQQPQIVYVQQKPQGHGCVVTAVVFLLFGWIGIAIMLTWKLLKLTWRASVAAVRWTWAASVASVRWSVRGGQALTARYGWRGWAVVGGVVVVLAVVSALVNHH